MKTNQLHLFAICSISLICLISLFPPQIMELVHGRGESILERTELGHTFLWSATPARPPDPEVWGFFRRTVDWERYSLSIIVALGILSFGFLSFDYISRFRTLETSVGENPKEKRNTPFTDDIVRDILAGKKGVVVNGADYLVGPTSLVSARKANLWEGSTSMRIGHELKYPKELLELLNAERKEPPASVQ